MPATSSDGDGEEARCLPGDNPATGSGTGAVAPHAVPLVVDLDGTLLHADLMVESLLLLLKRRPWRLLAALAWLFGGVARFKQKLACEAMPDIPSLPFDPLLRAYLKEQKAKGRRMVLATGADEMLARAVAEQTGLFDEVIASDGVLNVSGKVKRERLIARFGPKGFDYAGNGLRDATVWAAARRAILAGISSRYAERLAATVEIEKTFTNGKGGLKDYCRALRPTQWTKNLLVFLPLLMTHHLPGLALLLNGVLAWAAFSLCASSGYLFNDLMDLPNDRRHPAKKNRPLASGRASPSAALALVPMLLLAGLALGSLLPSGFVATLAGYYILTVAYSWRLKDIAVLDVLVLSALYTVRLFGGTLAFELTASVWLLAFCVFLFLSLALIKRYAELVLMRAIEGAHAHARAYLLPDAELLAALGAASGYVAGLVLVLFQVDRQVPGTIGLAGWIMCLLYIYWITYMWLMAHRGRMEDDPLTFALHNSTSRLLLVLAAATFAITWF